MSDPQIKRCGRCGATWANGKHYWATGREGNELDLAGLVCNTVDDPACINPCKGMEGGQTWVMRQAQAQMTDVILQQECQQPQARGR